MSKLLQELKKRTKEPTFDLGLHCFDKQLALIRDPAKFKTAVCSRRAGKTEACAADLFWTALNNPHVNVLYITLSRTTAKRIIWKALLKLKKDHADDAKVDNVELSITLPNGSTIYCSGAKDEATIESFRGLALKKVYIDECQSFRPYIQNLIDDVIVPALYDHDGSLILIGTPGPISSGYFYDASHGQGWSHHTWTILDNPWIKIKSGREPADILASERARRGITETDPTYLRESMGLWVQDLNSLVFKFNALTNITQKIPAGKMDYIFGIDIGYNDADAIAVLGYNYEEKKCYLVEELITSKQNITDLINQITKLRAHYNPVKMVMDAGALGKKIQAEITSRHAIPLEAADKNRKFEFIELLNDDLRTGKLMTLKGSRFQEDSNLLSWDRSQPGKLKVSENYHSDICDAVLYAWRECKHYLSERAIEVPPRDSAAYMQALEDREAEEMDQRNRGQSHEGPSPDDMDFILAEDWD